MEILAAFYGLKALCNKASNLHVRLQIDNTTAVSYINNMGGTRSGQCNKLAKEVWMWCINRNVWVSAAHLAGKLNVEADKCSRVFNDRTEWMLDKNVFQRVFSRFGPLEIDLFASRLNAQLPRFVSWHPEPGAEAVDAFLLDWSKYKFYAFPPFCLVGKCIQKIICDRACGVLVAPNWSTQPWFALLHEIMLEPPMCIKKSRHLVTQPTSGDSHPLSDRLNLIICRVSGAGLRAKPKDSLTKQKQ